MLKFLYRNVLGRCLLKVLTCPFVSKVAGSFCDSKVSKILIKPFVKKNKIRLDDYVLDDIHSFNDFFTRKIKDGLRPVSMGSNAFVSPCDGLLSVYKIDSKLKLKVKQSILSVEDLLHDKDLAQNYNEGIALVFRLCVHHYHRYMYIDDGFKEKNHYIKGKLHTVRPIALENVPVFTENAREYTILHTKNFGDVAHIEVGALLVGKIHNYHEEYHFKKGEEKGFFKYGGSTIILLISKGQIKLFDKYLKSSVEIEVKMGEEIGRKI